LKRVLLGRSYESSRGFESSTASVVGASGRALRRWHNRFWKSLRVEPVRALPSPPFLGSGKTGPTGLSFPSFSSCSLCEQKGSWSLPPHLPSSTA